ncbi:uncharacterized protein M421DRAFT_93853 [Didymella exigua CBS 183.55]|uniref:Uncharacterized protein n=1 Tax=Didymella exigua CBS 183.55 TaxID=1150837 RepID=A0A6A5RM55_9PLEO|nr:uncharacterized protein M421DRAFT_93853 [Didymella exigua CBS 183.55]KAF1926617.1 hypothetical protein M421DRAFT_93853 [Didymella exigua CBS 183.55]
MTRSSSGMASPPVSLRHTLGREVEADFTAKAKASGLTDEEASRLSIRTCSRRNFDRRFLVTSYEAGDVVLHNPFAASPLTLVTETCLTVTQIHASTMNSDPNNVIRVGTNCDS